MTRSEYLQPADNWQGPLWAWAPFERVQAIYQEARRAVPWRHCANPDPALTIQGWLRLVQAEFDRRLRAARIYVEGME